MAMPVSAASRFSVIVSLAVIFAVMTSSGSVTKADTSHSAFDVTGQSDDASSSSDRDVSGNLDSELRPLYTMTNFFLGVMVQPRFLTYMQAKGVTFASFQTIGDSFKGDGWRNWVMYLLGFAICAGVGFVTLLVMLVACFCLPCCRCCGKCGGKPSPKDGSRTGCARICCSFALFLVTCVLCLAAVCMIGIAGRLTSRLAGEDNAFAQVIHSLDGVDGYLNNSVQELKNGTYLKYVSTTDAVFEKLEAIPSNAITSLDNATGILEASEELSNFTEAMPSLYASLTNTSLNSNHLETMANDLGASIEAIKVDIFRILSNCSSEECLKAINSTEQLDSNSNYSQVAISLKGSSMLLDGILRSDFVDYVQAIGRELASVSQEVNETVAPQIENAKRKSDSVKEEILKTMDKLSAQVNSVGMHEVTKSLFTAESAVAKYDKVIYWSLVGLSIPLCLVVVVNLIGLLCGVACSRDQPGAGACACSRGVGARFLLAGTGFTLIFYWLYITLVLVLFLGVGLSYTEVCRNLINYNNTQSRKVLEVVDTLINNSVSVEIDILPFDIYRKCESDATLYYALDLENNGYNISKIIDLKDVADIVQGIKDQPLNIPQVNLTNVAFGQLLKDLDKAFNVDYAALHEELSLVPLTGNLTLLAHELESTGVAELNVTIASLKDLTDIYVDPMNVLRLQISGNLSNNIQPVAQAVNFSAIPRVLSASQTYINEEGGTHVSRFINSTADAILAEVEGLASRVISATQTQIGRCRPAYDAVTAVVDATCVATLYPLNGLWFALGAAIFFLIPSLILSFKLVTLFRKTEPHDDHEAVEAYDGGDYAPPGYPAYGSTDTADLLQPPYEKHATPYAIDNPVFDPRDISHNGPQPPHPNGAQYRAFMANNSK